MNSSNQEEHERAVQRKALALTDLKELMQQVKDGEIDEATAAGLQSDYEAELAHAEGELAQLGTLPTSKKPTISTHSAGSADPAPSDGAQPAGGRLGLNTRLLVGAAIFTFALVVILISVQQSTEPDPTAIGAAPGDSAGQDPCAELEAALADHADNAFRLALADCYLGAGDAMSAIEHYRAVEESDIATDGEASQASVGLGVLNIQVGEFEYAADYMRTALEADPANLDAQYFLGMLLVYDLDDPTAAVPYLEAVLEAADLSEDVLLGINDALTIARPDGQTP